ncbi:histidine phosphatase family protein [Phyllobacterium sp. K27]
MTKVYFVTHPEVNIDPNVPVPKWSLSDDGRKRIEGFCTRPELSTVTDVFVSDERKALDCAESFELVHGVDFTINSCLGENVRSSTGYVAPPKFWEMVDEFFARPEESLQGWEPAEDAQTRIKSAVNDCVASRNGGGDVVIFSHGGVGTLLLCDLMDQPISNKFGQPIIGGGCYFMFEAGTNRLIDGWRDIVP